MDFTLDLALSLHALHSISISTHIGPHELELSLCQTRNCNHTSSLYLYNNLCFCHFVPCVKYIFMHLIVLHIIQHSYVVDWVIDWYLMEARERFAFAHSIEQISSISAGLSRTPHQTKP